MLMQIFPVLAIGQGDIIDHRLGLIIVEKCIEITHTAFEFDHIGIDCSGPLGLQCGKRGIQARIVGGWLECLCGRLAKRKAGKSNESQAAHHSGDITTLKQSGASLKRAWTDASVADCQ